MKITLAISPRRILREVHLWIGLGIGLVIVPIGMSGALLIFSGSLDRLIDPPLYAVSGPEVGQDAQTYLANAGKAVPGARATRLRLPPPEGGPVTVMVRGGSAEGQVRQRASTQVVFLDPPTGQVLGVRDFRGSIVGLLHSFHANLLIPDFSGRQIVGWIGVGLLTLALSGIWLWWPRNAGFLRGLRWRRGRTLSINLHHTAGIWIALPLAVVALTGVSLSFSQQTRGLIAMFTTIQPRPAQGGTPMRQPQQSAAAVAAIALETGKGMRLTSMSLPTEQAKVWSIQLIEDNGALRTIAVDDATAAVKVLPPPAPGDAFATFLRQLHEGNDHGPLWQTLVFLCGVLPAVFFVTGLLMWLRRRNGDPKRTGSAPFVGTKARQKPAVKEVHASRRAISQAAAPKR
jgi:uncharacterized iron-regulated membrane protein